jgi:uncharacterized membrane protein YfcA
MEYLVPLLSITIVATLIGNYTLLQLSDAAMKKIVGFMMLGSLPFLFSNKSVGLERKETSSLQKKIGYVFYFIVVICQAAFAGGIGVLIPVIMMSLFGMTALESAATRRVPGIVGALLSLIVYVTYGIVDYKHGITLLCGTFIGGWIGTHIAVKKGDLFVKRALMLVVLLLSFKLLVL